MEFNRDDWKDFLEISTLCRKAGVSPDTLAMVVAKELTDNALDAAGAATVGLLADDGFYVADEGDGIDGNDRRIASLFSMDRPLRSSKRLRLPTRGALGNGLRVVAGVVFATAGDLIVATWGRTLRLIPLEEGWTTVERIGTYGGRGTRIEVRLGHPLRVAFWTLAWAEEAIGLAATGCRYKGKPSPHWFESDAFYQLLHDAGTATVRQVLAEFDGCAEPKAGQIARPFGNGRLARDLGRDEADRLLEAARARTRPVKAERLGQVGPVASHGHYTLKRGKFTVKPVKGRFGATIPFVVEAWASASEDGDATVRVSVNRTPITTPMAAYHDAKEKDLYVKGCGLGHTFQVGRDPITVWLNIDTPYMPLTSDGKAPDLTRFLDTIDEVLGSVGRAVKRGASRLRAGVKDSQEKFVEDDLDRAITCARGEDGTYDLRQLFYVQRPGLIELLGCEPNYKTYCAIITRIENRRGADLPGLCRSTRGTLYHPHTGEEIPLGTRHIKTYRRPEWTFNKILYCEKEGFFPILQGVQWAERNDCALLTSKGFASRAARDVIDLLGDSDEAITFFCIHDADAHGTRIYQALQAATRARPARRVKIENLGLEPEEALAMGLQVEEVHRRNKRLAPVADYVVDPSWRHWLQGHRVELNAMTSPQFLEWLDRKFARYAGKVVPPTEILRARLDTAVERILRAQITDDVLRRADIDGQVRRACRERESEIRDRIPGLVGEVTTHLEHHPEDLWTAPLGRIAGEICKNGDNVEDHT